jgi:predicted negative regulator of RcsB-dependent stress response
MTSHYEEEAEVEQLRRWWRENWIALAAGLVLGLGGIYGWEAWQALRTAQAEAASRAFEDLKGLPLEEQARAGQLWHSLSTEHAGTPYAAQAGLLLASHAAARQEWAAAQAKLEWVREHSDDPGLTKLATLRLARVLWQQEQADAALALLAIGDEDPFATLYH